MTDSNQSFLSKAQMFFEDKLIPIISKISSQRDLAAVRDGLTVLVPVTIIGGFAVLLAAPPVQAGLEPTNILNAFLCAWRDWSAANSAFLMTPYNLTIGIISVYVVMGVAYRLASHFNMDTISNVISSLLVFLCVAGVPESLMRGETAVTAIPLSGLGAGSMFAAILVALGVIEINHLFIARNWTIKLPDSVPPNVAAPFNVLIPGVVSLLTFLFLELGIKAATGAGLTSLVYTIFQPLISATGSLPSIIMINVLMTLFWFFGIHGGNMVGIITTPLTTVGLAANAEAYAAGQPLPYIFAGAVNSVYGGWTSYLAVVIVILFLTKSPMAKAIAKVALGPCLFNINEPLIFGLPTVLNPYTLITFLICNNVNFSIVYFLMQSGFLGKFFVTLPFTVPAPLQAYLASMDIKSIFVWAALLALDVVIATPFIRAYCKTLASEDAEYLEQEAALQVETASNEA